MATRILIFPPRIRRAEQSPGYSMNPREKLELARQLARLRVDVMEAGFPIASPDDFEAVKVVSQNIREGISIAGLCRTRDQDIDRAWEALQHAERPRIHTFIATSDIHMQYKLKMSREEVMEAAVRAVKRARGYTNDGEFSCEDACRTDPDFLCQMVDAAIKAGATTINIPDTVGYAMPWEYGGCILLLMKRVPNIDKVIVSAHCRNAVGLDVSNSIEGIRQGVRQVEC